MNRVQEMIDEHRNEMPVSLAKDLLEACRDEAQAQPRLYKIKLTHVRATPFLTEVDGDPEASVKLCGATRTLIVEAVDDEAWRKTSGCFFDKLNKGMVSKNVLDRTMPMLYAYGDDEVYIWHSVEPFVPHSTRARSDT